MLRQRLVQVLGMCPGPVLDLVLVLVAMLALAEPVGATGPSLASATTCSTVTSCWSTPSEPFARWPRSSALCTKRVRACM